MPSPRQTIGDLNNGSALDSALPRMRDQVLAEGGAPVDEYVSKMERIEMIRSLQTLQDISKQQTQIILKNAEYDVLKMQVQLETVRLETLKITNSTK
jgi:hypothetical protein